MNIKIFDRNFDYMGTLYYIDDCKYIKEGIEFISNGIVIFTLENGTYRIL